MEMEKRYNHKSAEERIYKMWEDGGYFTPKIDNSKKPFTILLPLPNANDPMHMGHALFTIQDILIRYHRMLGDSALWLPGGDHAGIETQFVFEKKLAKKGKSRFDYDRKTLYKLISKFVEKNKDINKKQMKKLGFSLDWTRYHYSLEPKILEEVFDTFRKLYKDGLIYRDERLVNYCTKCGTAFSDLEIKHTERDGFLYYIDYETLVIATTRPETIFADAAVAVNPKDKRYAKNVGEDAVVPIINKKIPIIADGETKMDFGTGALKVTPGHDETDFKIGKKHNLQIIKIIGYNGRMVNVPNKYVGMKVDEARETVIKDLKNLGKLVKVEPIKHTISICYKCGSVLEPLPMPQWYVKMKPLAKPAIKAVKSGETKIFPKKTFEKMYFGWLENIYDWNISRQIVWGPRIPAWYCLDCNPNIVLTFLDKNNHIVSGAFAELKRTYSFEEIKNGLQQLNAPVGSEFSLSDGKCSKCGGNNILQETDTFDTWFLSGQWPITTLGFPNGKDFKYFYPTSVLDTLWDIIFFWVARMMMLCIYRTGKAPFKVIHLHARVVDKNGAKMSKSKGNVINPIGTIEKYGADALRLALVFGVAPGSNIAVDDDKIRSMRNFANKVWNIGRFIEFVSDGNKPKKHTATASEDIKILNEFKRLIKDTGKYIDEYRFDFALEGLYQFIWHRFADDYLENSKNRFKTKNGGALSTLFYIYTDLLKMLHPFMPFVTETIWGELMGKEETPLIISRWPSP